MDEPQTGRHRLPDAGQWMRLLQRHQSEHPALLRILDVFERLQDRPYKTNVVIYGEPGTGKEGLARALHALMHDRPVPFVECSLVGRDVGVAAAELCGEPGTEGLIERANGGTLYVDGIVGLAEELQLRLLGAIRGKVKREGEVDERPVRLVVVVAADGDLSEEVQAKRFRSDLFWRLARVELRLPSLSERRADIGRLALWIGTRILNRAGVDGRLMVEPEKGDLLDAGADHESLENRSENDVMLTQAALRVLEAHRWPGNLRELDAVLERTLLLYAPKRGVVTEQHVKAALADRSE
jgi:two-component system response regulator AtoC